MVVFTVGSARRRSVSAQPGIDHFRERKAVTSNRTDALLGEQGGAQHVVSRLMRESLVDKTVIAGTEAPVRAILPKLNVIQIGGLSIMDRGHAAVLPLLDEIVANQDQHAQVVGVGPGVRARHIFAVGLDLGLPTGALATLAAKSSAQNAYMVACLLADSGFVYLEAPFIVQLLPAMLAAARGAVFNAIPPYDLWEHPPAIGKIPPHGSDAGSYLRRRGVRRALGHPVEGCRWALHRRSENKLGRRVHCRDWRGGTDRSQAADIADRAGGSGAAGAGQARQEHPHRQCPGAGQSYARAQWRADRNSDP